MIDETLTVPCEGIGVWEGARVIYAPARGYQGSLRRPGDVGIVVAAEQRDSAVWASVAFGADIEPHPLTCLRLDLTHRMTRLEAMARLGARVGTDVGEGVLWFRQFARWTWMVDGVAGASASWAPEEDGGASIVPALADLDPTDDTRLPDGARVVDVQALARVLRQVFTPPQPPPPQPR